MTRARPLIAVVDDEESIRRALQRLIRSAGLDVETFPSGSAFIDSVAAHPPDCLVLDLHMPGLSGFDVQARLMHLTARLPVVVLTAHDSPEVRTRVMEAGAASFLRKPVDDQVLLDAIASAIAGGSPPVNEKPSRNGTSKNPQESKRSTSS